MSDTSTIECEPVRAFAPLQQLAFNIMEVSAATGICRSMLLRAINRGELKTKRNGTKLLFTAQEVERFIATMPDRTAPDPRFQGKLKSRQAA